jgi:phosphoglycerol transferase MdoB-like AlkP superfamily enzyme
LAFGIKNHKEVNAMAGLKPTEEQLAYASLLDLGRKIGFIGLVITFIIYLFQLLPSYIPPNELLSYLKLNLHDYLEKTGIQQGWYWVTMLRYSDFLPFLPICFLPFVTIICFFSILPILLKKGDKVYVFLSIIQILILLLAASGFLKVGH